MYNLQYTGIKLCFFFSGNHCWVSFTGFAKTYTDIRENSIEKHASLFMNDNMEAEGINTFSLSENNSSRMVVNAIYACLILILPNPSGLHS